MHVTSKVCKRMDLGLCGNLFGGNMLAWMDEAAFIYAKQATNEQYLVTLKFSEILFKHPVKEGDIVDFFVDEEQETCPEVGTSSITFNLYAKVKALTVVDTKCTFVAVNSLGFKKDLNPNVKLKFDNMRTYGSGAF